MFAVFLVLAQEIPAANDKNFEPTARIILRSSVVLLVAVTVLCLLLSQYFVCGGAVVFVVCVIFVAVLCL